MELETFKWIAKEDHTLSVIVHIAREWGPDDIDQYPEEALMAFKNISELVEILVARNS